MAIKRIKSDIQLEVCKSTFKDLIVPLLNSKSNESTIDAFLTYYTKRINELFGDQALSVCKAERAYAVENDKTFRGEDGTRDLKRYFYEAGCGEPITTLILNFKNLICDMVKTVETRYKFTDAQRDQAVKNFVVVYTRSTDLEVRMARTLSPITELLHWRGTNIVGYTEPSHALFYSFEERRVSLFIARTLLTVVDAFDTRAPLAKLFLSKCEECNNYFVMYKKGQRFCSEGCSIKAHNKARPKKSDLIKE